DSFVLKSFTSSSAVFGSGTGDFNAIGGASVSFAVAAVPEPGTLALFGTALVGLGSLMRRRRQQLGGGRRGGRVPATPSVAELRERSISKLPGQKAQFKSLAREASDGLLNVESSPRRRFKRTSATTRSAFSAPEHEAVLGVCLSYPGFPCVALA